MGEGADGAGSEAKLPPQKSSARQASFAAGRSKSFGTSGEMSRAKLLAAAARAFMEKGFAATSIDDVASRLGATKGLVYHHYRSKNDLFFDVCRHGLEIVVAVVEPHAAARDRGLTRLRRMCEAHALAVLERLEFLLVLLQGVSMHRGGSAPSENRAALDAIMKERERYEGLFRQAMDASVRQGDLPEPADASLAIEALMAVLNAPAAWYRPQATETAADRSAIARGLAIFVLRGVGVGETIIEEEFQS